MDIDLRKLKNLQPLVLYQIALDLDLPQLIVLCQLEPKFNRAVCLNNRFWNEFKNYPKSVQQPTAQETYTVLQGLLSLQKIFQTNPWNTINNNSDGRILSSYSLEELSNLQSLNLRNNKLESVPKELGNLINLQYLSLYNNKLESVPKELGNLINLQRLYLSNNNLESVPKEIRDIPGIRIYK